MEKIINFIASGFGISYIPVIFFKRDGKFKGCGLAGTILAFLIYPYLIPQNYYNRLIFIIFISLFSIIISSYAFKKEGEKDNPLIVIDEITGYFTGFLFIEKNLKNAIILFIFFRIFDTIKPFPIKDLEKIKHNGISIVIDDIFAGIYAGISCLIINLIKQSML